MQSTVELFQEGITRGLSTIPYRFIKQFAQNIESIIDATKSSDEKIRKAVNRLHEFRVKFKNMDIDLKEDRKHQILKAIDKLGIWRHHFILNDKIYKRNLEKIKNDKDAPNIWVNIGWKEREVPEIYNMKGKDDILKIISKYEMRMKEIGEHIKKEPHKEKLYTKMLTLGLYGLFDLFNVIHSVVSYGSKGL